MCLPHRSRCVATDADLDESERILLAYAYHARVGAELPAEEQRQAHAIGNEILALMHDLLQERGELTLDRYERAMRSIDPEDWIDDTLPLNTHHLSTMNSTPQRPA